MGSTVVLKSHQQSWTNSENSQSTDSTEQQTIIYTHETQDKFVLLIDKSRVLDDYLSITAFN
jgi:hypothetical protein